jgi:hypothetical protein
MSELTLSTVLDTALIGGIPVKIVKNNSHALGEVAVGHSVGKGVRVFQKTGTDLPEQISLRCRLIGSDRFTKKFLLEGLKALRIPFPFVTRLVALPRVRITGLVFTMSSEIKNVDDKRGIIDFSISMQEQKFSGIIFSGIIGDAIKLATKIAWVLSANTGLDPANQTALTFSNDDKKPPANSAVVGTTYICLDLDLSLGEREQKYQDLYYYLQDLLDDPDEVEEQFNASLRLDSKFDRLPLAPQDQFPQTIKINYPKVPIETEEFNTEEDLNEVAHLQSDLYYFPEYSVTDSKEYLITITPVQSFTGNIVTSMLVESNGETLFDSKILPCELYTFEDIEIKFSTIIISPDSIYGTSQNTKIVGGIRLRE